MAQKPLFKSGVNKPPRRKAAPNRHGKGVVTKRGTFVRPPRKPSVQAATAEDAALTATINARNEAKAAASAAAAPGGRFTIIQVPKDGGNAGRKGVSGGPGAPKGAPKGV